MVNVEGVLLFIGGLLTLLLGVFIGYRMIDRLLSRGVYSIENAEELLKLGRPEEWNALRSLNPNWQPVLISTKLANLNLSGINLQRAKLDGSDLSKSVLDDADFSRASLVNVDLSNASLRQVRFEGANLSGAKLKDALLEGATFKNANLQNTDLPAEKLRPVAEPQVTDQKDLFPLIYENPDALSTLAPEQFEKLVAEVLRRSGYEAELMGGPGDKGIDIIALRRDLLGEITTIVQCKHYTRDHAVGVSSVRAFYAVKQLENAERAVFVTSSRFTNEAKAFASSISGMELIDREQLIAWIRSVY